MSSFHIVPGFDPRDRAAVVAMLRAYEAGLGVSLCFQGFEAELAGLPGAYAPPLGQMLLARAAADEALAGMVALRPVPGSAGLCEMKRLFVRPEARGTGLGRRLALTMMQEAARLGYRRICLDTLPGMREAQALYRALGFRQTGIQTSIQTGVESGTSSAAPTVLLFERELAVA